MCHDAMVTRCLAGKARESAADVEPCGHRWCGRAGGRGPRSRPSGAGGTGVPSGTDLPVPKEQERKDLKDAKLMGKGRYLLSLALVLLSQRPIWGKAGEDSASNREYKVKAAFVYNFLKFVVGGRFGAADEKPGSDTDPKGTLVVGVCGKVPSKGSFAELQGKLVKNKHLKVQFFKGFDEWKDSEQKIPEQHPQMAELRQCHVLFFCPSEKLFLTRLLPHLQKDGILLVGDTPGFLEGGGTINLRIEEQKVRFEINLAAARRARVEIRSSLLRLAARIVEHDRWEEESDAKK